MGGVGSRVVFWTWPALEAACARVCVCALVLVPGVGAGARHSCQVHRGQDGEIAVGDRDASVLEPALLRPPRGPVRVFVALLAACLRTTSQKEKSLLSSASP